MLFTTITVLKNQILDHKDYTKNGNITWCVRLVHHLLNLKNLLVRIGCEFCKNSDTKINLEKKTLP